MNFVVLTAALSSLNAGLYSTGRILHSMAQRVPRPKFTGRMNKRGVPYGGILLTGGDRLLGVGLNSIVPAQAFEIVLNVVGARHRHQLGDDHPLPDAAAAVGDAGQARAAVVPAVRSALHLVSDARLPGGRAGADGVRLPDGTFTVASLVDHRAAADPRLVRQPRAHPGDGAAREGYTGPFPVVAERPGLDRSKE